MKLLSKRLSLSNNQVSLFYTLFISYIAIILLFLSINVAAYSFFRDRIKDEIIINSGLNMQTTVANYEKHIKLMQSFMLRYMFDNDTQIMKKNINPIPYDIVLRTQRELRIDLNNSLLYLENIIYYFKENEFVIDKEGTQDLDTMFSKFYVSNTYSPEFWRAQVEQVENVQIYPSEFFRLETAYESLSMGHLIPILVKSPYDDKLAFILMLNAAKTYEAFHRAKPGSSLYIMDNNRSTIFSSSPAEKLPAGFMNGENRIEGSGYINVGSTYYFYQTGAETGFMYVEAVTDRGLSNQLRNLNIMIIVLLALSVLSSLAISYIISKKFHNPLSRMIKSIQAYNVLGGPGAASSRIKEFNMLHSTLSNLSRSNEQFHHDLQAKNSMLQQFAYMSKLKNIGGAVGLSTSLDEERPYRLVLFQLDFKDRFLHDISTSPLRAFNSYKQLIDVHFSSLYSESLTFQLEKDQILTILFLSPEQADAREADLRTLIDIFHVDSMYCNFTIAPSPVCRNSTDFAETYQNALDMLRQRKIGEDVQIITEWKPHPSILTLTSSKEVELSTNLHSGCDSVTIPLVEKLLDQLDKSGATAIQFQELSKDIVNRAIKAMYSQAISINTITDGNAVYDQLKACYTLEQYKQFFHSFLTRTAVAIQEKKSETDTITKFVIDYVETHYGGDASLEAIADKLGITSPYLSSYFKEKTGTNFSDYIYTVRMNKATEMLLETDLLIQEIASLVGYFSVASFNRVFKRFTGITPSEFRRQNKTWGDN
ncbi:helix-turn-helix domain-containing protein [Paenibacillus sp. strain BS8-2]